MNTLVLYDLQYGNTERIAQAIADAMGAFGPVRAVRVDPSQKFDGDGLELLMVGCPTQGWNTTRVMRAFLQTLAPEQLSDIGVACFDTRFHKPRWLTGSAAKVMHRMFRRMGVVPLAPPESFFVEGSEGPLERGELERAAAWAQALARAAQAAQPAMP